jgi:quinol monooxygenase YgiN
MRQGGDRTVYFGGDTLAIAVVDAKAGHAAQLRAAIEELAAAVRCEPGCLTFVP